MNEFSHFDFYAKICLHTVSRRANADIANANTQNELNGGETADAIYGLRGRRSGRGVIGEGALDGVADEGEETEGRLGDGLSAQDDVAQRLVGHDLLQAVAVGKVICDRFGILVEGATHGECWGLQEEAVERLAVEEVAGGDEEVEGLARLGHPLVAAHTWERPVPLARVFCLAIQLVGLAAETVVARQ